MSGTVEHMRYSDHFENKYHPNWLLLKSSPAFNIYLELDRNARKGQIRIVLTY